MAFSIQPLTCLDYASIRDIFSELFLECEDAKFRVAWRHRRRSVSLGIYKNKDLVGFALVKGTQLAYIGIHWSFQAFGLGSKLLRAVMSASFERCRNVHLTPVYNEDLICWYIKHGFKLTQKSESDIPGVPYLVYNAHKYPTRNSA